MYSPANKRFGRLLHEQDANKAGTKQSQECTLIVTEGDSAKACCAASMKEHQGATSSSWT